MRRSGRIAITTVLVKCAECHAAYVSLPSAFSGSVGSGSLTFASMSGPVSLLLASLDTADGFGVTSPPDADRIASRAP